ncbi:TetR/AcrR family transcriptional regulator [Sciscionella sediminilitoris]|uniref:TetR/AcrR family transcriptional regulator n=1 Tax=Sciscionella sediminilitoris TaxID=1445613 RepID=UPI0004DED27D|nr:TetR/AcrR family transcriptional regulator [Sciscionella sp. SE31]
MNAKRARADQILDAAAELLVTVGYRKVTIDEVAERANVGKGTVYLHWRSRDELLLATLTREGATLMSEIVAAGKIDPATFLPHRFFRLILRRVLDRPLLHGIYTLDSQILGKLSSTASGTNIRNIKILTFDEYFGLLSDNGILRADLSITAITYGVTGMLLGCVTIDPMLPEEWELTADDKADVFAGSIRSAYENEQPDHEALATIAPKLLAQFDELASSYREFVYHKAN